MVFRIGLDLAWYIRNGFGSGHGLNANLNPVGTYNYLTHGWKNNGGSADGSVLPAGYAPGSGSGGGGFFTCYAYDVHSPPLYPPQYTTDRSWILSFIQAADADSGRQKAKIFVRFILENNFDPTMVGTFWDFCEHLGTADKHPSIVGFGFRGAQEGIETDGGACSGGCEGANFIPAMKAYGPTGMNAYPQNTAQLTSMWQQLQAIANAYGYNLGVSTGLSNMDSAACLGTKDFVDGLAQWFVQGETIYPSVTAPTSGDGTYTNCYNTFYNSIRLPERAPSVSKGLVFGEWDPNWFKENYPQSGYYVTLYGLQAALQGASDAFKAAAPPDDRYWMIYGMPSLTNDNGAQSCDYLPTLVKYANQYGYMTDFSPVPAPPTATPVTPPVAPTWIPTGLYIAIQGNPALASQKPPYSQTNPVYCCRNDSFTISGALTRLDTGAYVGGETIVVYTWDYTACQWAVLTKLTSTSTAPPGLNTNYGPLTVKSPPLPGTKRNQAYMYPAFLGGSTYGPSDGVLEDLPVLGNATKLSLAVTQV